MRYVDFGLSEFVQTMAIKERKKELSKFSNAIINLYIQCYSKMLGNISGTNFRGSNLF